MSSVIISPIHLRSREKGTGYFMVSFKSGGGPPHFRTLARSWARHPVRAAVLKRIINGNSAG
jgi:hypothetical protein